MELNNCQYYKIDSPIEEIAKMKVNNNNNYKFIEDIDIGDIVPNILVYFNNYDNNPIKPIYDNIFPSVKILITNNKGMKNGLWKKIPEYIEYIIYGNRLYKNNKDKLDFIVFEDEKIIQELIDEGKINEWNINGETTQTKSEFLLQKAFPFDETVLYWSCVYKMINVALKLIDRMSNEAINKWNYEGNTVLYWTCKNNMSDATLKLIDRMSVEAINKWNYKGETVLYWTCLHNISEAAMKLIDKMSDEAINKWNTEKYTALLWACYNKMVDVAIKLIDRMSNEAINKKYEQILNFVRVNNMEEVKIKLFMILFNNKN